MEKVASLAILLVCFIVSYAHVAAGVPVVGGRNTWHVYDVNGTSKSSSIKSPESTNDSVVESWSLVCEDLCRVGFGGPRCDPSCIGGPTRRSFDASKFSDYCPVLCRFELGGRNCDCPYVTKRLSGKNICHFLCKTLKLKVRGCSECNEAENDIDDISGNPTTEKSDPTEMVTATTLNSNQTVDTSTATHAVETTSKSSTETSPTAEPTAAANEPSTESPTEQLTDETETSAEITSEAATETTTTESSTPTEPSTTTTPASTTPNWSLVCQDLCKIGEGGSLCNCDLPPLMSAH